MNQRNTALAWQLLVVLLATIACGCGEVPPDFVGEDPDLETSADGDVDGDTDTDTDIDADTDTDMDTDTDTDIDSDTDTDRDMGSDTLDFDTEKDAGAGTDTDTGSDVDAPCAKPSAKQQSFGEGEMVGCGGRVVWKNARSLCGTGWHLCSAREWVDQREDKKPKRNYWTADELRWGGREKECWVDEEAGVNCPVGMPMRVCSGEEDDLKNRCNWTECSYGPNSRGNDYFGGCEGNPTAGALCCR